MFSESSAPFFIPPSSRDSLYRSDIIDRALEISQEASESKTIQLNAASGQDWLKNLFLDDPIDVRIVMFIMGIAKTNLESLFSDLSIGKICDEEGAMLKDLMKFNEWRMTAKLDAGIEAGKPDNNKRIGLANLFVNGPAVASAETAYEYKFLGYDNIRILLDHRCMTKGQVDIRYDEYWRGTESAYLGNLTEDVIKNILVKLGIGYTQGKIGSDTKTWDIITSKGRDLQTVTEISIHNATASGISNKVNAMLRDIEKSRRSSPNTKFFFLGGGSGWSQRPSDVAKVESNFDACFGYGTNDVIAYVTNILEIHERNATQQEIEEVVKNCVNELEFE